MYSKPSGTLYAIICEVMFRVGPGTLNLAEIEHDYQITGFLAKFLSYEIRQKLTGPEPDSPVIEYPVET